MMTPSWAEQGIARPSRPVAINRSRREPTIRVVITAIVTQPTPTIIGTIARPFRPSRERPRSVSTASRGSTPESSRAPITT